MSQRDFARALGKIETEVSRWLSGTHNLNIATIAKMSSVLADGIIKLKKHLSLSKTLPEKPL